MTPMNQALTAVLLAASLALSLDGYAAPAPPPGTADSAPGFQPPDEASLPDDEFGRTVRRGKDIFVHTDSAVPQFTGNHLQCQNCHLDAGRKADAAPLWGAYGLYPAYRKKNHHVNTFSERLQECFLYSMNGRKPPPGDPALVALESYAYWLSRGAPLGVKLKSLVYRQRCAACHQADGAGTSPGGGAMRMPALWGDNSFNWGAGMHQVGNAAGFIKANMPLGQGNSLSDQEAWDVASYIDSHERPQDPRFTGSVAETRQLYHDEPDSMYGLTVEGHLLGSGSTAPGKKP